MRVRKSVLVQTVCLKRFLSSSIATLHQVPAMTVA